jgi:hypothetical protein
MITIGQITFMPMKLILFTNYSFCNTMIFIFQLIAEKVNIIQQCGIDLVS